MWQKIKNVYHLGNALLANLWFGLPTRNLTVIGVTGTDGKTTTVNLIYHILKTAGCNVSMISSVGAVIGGKEYDVGFHVTTPSPWALQRFLREIINSSNNRLEKFDNRLHGVRHSGEEFCNSERRLQNLSAYSMAQRDFGRALLRQAQDSLASLPPKLQRRRARMTMGKVSYLVLETTSHAIDQNRIWGIPFDIGVLTNVTHEHLDYHKTYENYLRTKARLLKMARVAVVNRDDKSYDLIENIKNKIEKIHIKNKRWITYGMKSNSDVNPRVFPFKTNLIGEFNRYNVLAAVAACRNLGIDGDIIREAILTFKPPIGRGKIVSGQVNFTVMVDFAHTPNAFEQILSALKPSIKGRLIHVFGAAGHRDASKRPLMGKASAKYSDIIILTAEDPRSESVEKIINEIESGVPNSKFQIRNSKQFSKFEFSNIQNNKKYVFKIPNRQEAISAAIKMARKTDLVLITGKGHEKSMNYGKGEEQWDEFETVKKALFERKG